MKTCKARSPLAFVRWLRNSRSPARQWPRRVAGVLATKDYTGDCSTFETLQDLCDVTIVFDDNSASPFPHRNECSEYIAARNGEQWNAPANLTLLLYRAYVHRCEWIVSLDDDIIPSHDFQNRRDVDAVVDRMQAGSFDICHFRLMDFWNSVREVRVDGIWSRKTFPVVRRNWFFYDGITLRDPALRLHTAAFPANLRTRSFIHPAHIAYHSGCLTPIMRAARVAKYRREDPLNTFQADYTYMLDDKGLEVEAVSPDDLEIVRRKHRSWSSA